MSSDVRDVVMSASKAEVFRIGVVDDNGDPIKPKGRDVIAYSAVILGGPHTQSGSWRKSLQSALTTIDQDPMLNTSEMAKPCDPLPGVAVRFIGAAGMVDMLICYECDMLAFAEVGAQDVLGWWNFDTQTATFIQLAKQALPRDKEIQNLGKRE